MPLPQPGGIVNLLLVFLFGGGGWILAAYLKTAPVRHPEKESIAAGVPRNEPGIFAADALHILAAGKAGAKEFDDLLARYGSGTSDLQLLAVAVMEKWAAADAAGALSAGLPRCRDHAPGALPRAMALLGVRPEISVTSLMAALPSGPLRRECLSALGEAWGQAGKNDALAQTGAFTPGERALFVRDWHRGRGAGDLPAAQKSAAALSDPDDRAAAMLGCLLARAATEPEAVLREAAGREDFPQIAETAFRRWLARDSGAAWNFAASLKDDLRVTHIAEAVVKAEMERRSLSETMPELTTLLGRLFPASYPAELTGMMIPALAAERGENAQKFIEQQAGSPDIRRHAGVVVLFDTLCAIDPPAAWRLAEFCVQAEGAKDGRAAHQWISAMKRDLATPQQRLDAGFPDFTDMSHLALHWLKADPAAAINTFCSRGVDAVLQRMVIETALSTSGGNIPAEELLEWAKKQPSQIHDAIKARTGK